MFWPGYQSASAPGKFMMQRCGLRWQITAKRPGKNWYQPTIYTFDMPLDESKRPRLEPDRIAYAKSALDFAGFSWEEISPKSLRVFMPNGCAAILYPYTGWFTGRGIKDGRGIQTLINQLEVMQNAPLLPTDEGKQLLANYMKTAKRIDTDKMLTMLRAEWRMSHKVYGNKVARSRPGKARSEAVAEYCKRMQMITQLAEMVKTVAGGEQTSMNL
jgi:hypothetical protein